MRAADLIDRLGAVPVQSGEGFEALCPVHEADGAHTPSLKLDFTDEGRALIVCRSRGCDFGAIIAAVGFAPRDLVDVSYVGQSTRRSGGGKTAAQSEARVTAADGAYRAARALAEHLVEEPAGQVGTMLADRFGLDLARLDSVAADVLGIGLDPESLRVTVTARTASGAVAYVQGRATNPADPLRWTGLKNPEEGRWDGAGFVGRVEGRRPVLVVEGPSDGLTAAVLDLFDVVAVRGASQARRISEVDDALVGRTVVIAADQDPAGRRFAGEVASTLSPTVEDLRTATLPEGQDLGEYRATDPDTFRARLLTLVDEAPRFERPEPPFSIEQYVSRGAGDSDNAAALVAYAETLGYGISWNRAHGFLFFSGQRWIPNAEIQLRGLSHRLGSRVRRDAGNALAAGNQDRAKWLFQVASAFLVTRHIDHLLREVPAIPGVYRETSEFDSDKDVILAANGVVDLRTGQVRPVRRTDYMTRQLAVAYRADAPAPRWRRFLEEVLVDEAQRPDQELIRWMQRLVGYSITGRTSEEIAVILSGRGGNGKSKMIGALEHVFAGYSKTTPFETLEHRPNGSGIPADLAALAGARLVFAHEAEGGRLAEGRIKAVSGGDSITARHLHHDFFTFQPEFQLFISANKRPDVRGQDNGIWRRLRLVQFRATFEGQTAERNLTEQLAAEAEGILAWAVDGATAWYSAGRRLPACAAVDSETAEYRTDSDVLGQFLGEHLERTDDPKDVVFYGDLWDRYVGWASEQDDSRVRSSRKLGALLDERIGPRAGTVDSNGRRRTAFPAHVRGWRLMSEAAIKRDQARARLAVLGEQREPSPEEIAAEVTRAPIPVPTLAAKYGGLKIGRAPDLSEYGSFAGADLDSVLG